jgi:hypothetical protein
MKTKEVGVITLMFDEYCFEIRNEKGKIVRREKFVTCSNKTDSLIDTIFFLYFMPSHYQEAVRELRHFLTSLTLFIFTSLSKNW